jgi:fibronectin type 3 domain-containing protein
MNKNLSKAGKGRSLGARLLFAAAGLFLAGALVAGATSQAYGAIAQYEITATSANTNYGTVAGSGLYTTEESATVTATPKAGYRFVDWREGNPLAPVSTSAVYTFPVSAPRSLTATFAAIGTPVLSSAVSGGYDSVKLAWSAVAGASGYEVYKATSATGTYTKASTVTGAAATVTGLAAGKTYYFKVRAKATAGATVTYGALSAAKSAVPLTGTPSVTAASASYTSVKLSWAAVPGASGYYIYRATSATGTYSYLTATATATSYTNSGLVTGKTYYYKVRAYHLEGTTKVFGNYSAYKYAKPVPAAPATTTAYNKTYNSIKISWSGVSGATKYQVYRATSATGTYSLVATTTSTVRTYTNTGLANGSTYYYKVRAYHVEGTTSVIGYFGKAQAVQAGSCYYSGTYLVGRDIPSGEFLFFATDISKGLFYTSEDGTFDTLLGGSLLDVNCYYTLKSGEYLTIEYGKAYPVNSKFSATPKVPLDADGNLRSAMYKVGRDIPAGTYILYPDAVTGDGYMETSLHSTFLESDLIGYDYFRGRCPVTVHDGEYLYFTGSVGYTPDKAPAIVPVGGYLPEGMYKVGADGDIPAGTYTLTPTDPDYAYFYIYSDDSHSVDSCIIADTVDSDYEIELVEGDYILLYYCKLELPVI